MWIMKPTARMLGIFCVLALLSGCAAGADSEAAAERGAAQARFWHSTPAYFWPYPAAPPLGGGG
jgi:hypothetical protein